MSDSELSRHHESQKVHEKRQTIVRAAMNLGLSTRQVKRLPKRLRIERPTGLISRKVGKRGNRQLPTGLKELAVDTIRDHYTECVSKFGIWAASKPRDSTIVNGSVLEI
jgi:hypothetical protein